MTHNDGAALAITGLACRFPGDGNNLKNFWNSICNGTSAWSEIPKDRFDRGAFGAKIPDGAHFLTEDISCFDASFFSITAEEARAMDPQQRMMVEVVYEALETAGYPLREMKGTSTGVFVGHSNSDYHSLVARDLETALPASLTGLQRPSLANRISWLFDLQGPSFTCDTACSSSLTALHLACQSLQSRECDLAIVGGCNMLISPDMFFWLGGQGFLSKDGKCKPFDTSADGYGRGEGIGVVVIRRVDDAISHGDSIRAVIPSKGTGINQDGHTKGFTLPSADAQASLIRDVYNNAGLDFSQTGYVEAHGTGTKAGDLEETTALARTISASRSDSSKLIVGSVKSNIGHLEAASGVAGVIKSVMMLEKGLIPPNVHFHNPNPTIKFEEWNLTIPTEMMSWPSSDVRRISINSFGYGGSNAHVIIDDARSFLNHRGLPGIHFTKASAHSREGSSNGKPKARAELPPAGHRLFVITAQDQNGLGRVKKSLTSFLSEKNEEGQLLTTQENDNYFADLAFTLNERRSHLQWKTYCIASSLDDLRENLESAENVTYMSSRAPRLGFVFTGQGAQWQGMGVELMKYAAFRNSINAADDYLRQELGCSWSVTEEFARGKSSSKMGLALYSQALCTILQLGLVDLLREWNIVPVAVVGHSSGEIAAAYCFGVLSRQDAWKVAYYRGLFSSELRDSGIEGGMMAVGTSPKEAADVIFQLALQDSVYIACINSPNSITVSGDVDAIDVFHKALQAKGIFARKLKVDVAYHSPFLEEMAPEYFEAIADISTNSPTKCEMFSSVSGALVDPSGLGAAYWIRNLISPVNFASAIQELVRSKASEIDVLVEIGPHSALLGPTQQSLQSIGLNNVVYSSVLTRNQSAVETALNLAGMLFARGYPINFAKINNVEQGQTLVDLPAYPWNHSQSLWAESRVAKEYRLREAPRSSLLGTLCPTLVAGEKVFRGHIRLSEQPWSSWLADHKISGSVVCPGAVFLVMAIEAAMSTSTVDIAASVDATKRVTKIRLRDIHIIAALVVDSEVEYTVSLKPHLGAMRETSSAWMEFTVTSCQDGKSLQKNCLGLIKVEYEASTSDETAATLTHYEEAKKLCKTALRPQELYRDLAAIGLELGPTFRNISDLKIGFGQSCYVVEIPDIGLELGGLPQRPHIIHPVVLDAIIQTPVIALRLDSDVIKQTMVPKFIGEIVISADIAYEAGTQLKGFSNATKYGFKELISDVTIMGGDENQKPVMQISGFCFSEVAGASGVGEGTKFRSLCSKLVWRPTVNLLPLVEQKSVITRATQNPYPSKDATTSISVLLAELIKLVHHCKPDLLISEFVASTAYAQPYLADPSLADVLKTAECSIYCDDSTRQSIQKVFGEESAGMRVNFRDLSQALPGQGEVAHPSDLVIMPAVLSSTEQAVRNAKQLLAVGGRLCLIVPACQSQKIENLGRSIGLVNWIRFDDFDDSSKQQMSFLVGSSEEAVSTNGIHKEDEDTTITIIQSVAPSRAATSLAEQIQRSLSSLGCTASFVTWGGKDAGLAFKGNKCISLLEIDRPILKSLRDEQELDLVKTLILESKQLLWVSGVDDHDPSNAMVTGLARVVRNEEPGLVFQTLHVNDWHSYSSSEKLGELILRLFVHQNSTGNNDNEFMVENGVICVSRVLEDDALNEELHSMNPQNNKALSKVVLGEAGPLQLCVQNAGLLDSLCFELDPVADRDLEEDDVEIAVKATSLNFRDVMTVMGSLPFMGNQPGMGLGWDAAGIVCRVGSGVAKFKIGDRIAMLNPGAHRTVHRAKVECCEIIPDGFTFEEAASIPIVHGTAWYALVQLAQARKGQTILIHAAAGGVGQAAIQLAQHLGMEIFATVGSDVKRSMLRDSFKIPNDHIFNSRNLSFVAGIKRMTKGRGVDIVLNSLSGEALQQTWSCIAPFGCFVELGVKDMLDNARLDMKPFLQSATFTFFDAGRIIRDRRDLVAEIMKGTFEMQRRGITRPVAPLVTYPISEVETAFRVMQQSKHMGKLILSFTDEQQSVPVLHRRVQPLNLDPEAAYVLIGGLGGLGRSLSNMLIDNGARKLSFLARSGAKADAAQKLVHDLQERGIQVLVQHCDVADEEAVRDAIKLCTQKLGRVRGIIQCAMVLRDTLFRNMTYQDWTESTRPKVKGTWNLHQILQNDVDFFVILSSFAAIFGNRGQSNYAAAGSYQDAIARLRRARGMHAVTVDVGLMRDVGVLAEQGITAGLQDWEVPYGIRENELANIIKIAIAGDMAFSVSPQIITGIATGGSATVAGIDKPWYLDDPKFAIMAKSGIREEGKGAAQEDTMQARLSMASSQVDAAEVVVDALVTWLAKMLQTTAAEIDTERFLNSYGIDSLSAIELVNWSVKECKSHITVFDVMASVPITVAAKKIATNSKLLSGKWAEAE